MFLFDSCFFNLRLFYPKGFAGVAYSVSLNQLLYLT